jgi:16S rRNA (guanine966-N2)-methyltransferase
MRIIAGAKRGMKLLSPKGNVSRPITDRVKESLFSVLYKYELPDGKMVADLFCGVGSLGLEALSRGAEFVSFIEKNPKIIAILKKNIEKAGFVSKSKVIRADAFRIGAPVDMQKYDLIFVDPPYATSRDTKENSLLGKLLVLLSEQSAKNGIVVVRTEKRTSHQLKHSERCESEGGTILDRKTIGAGLKQYGRLEVIERRQWGTMAVTILRKCKS